MSRKRKITVTPREFQEIRERYIYGETPRDIIQNYPGLKARQVSRWAWRHGWRNLRDSLRLNAPLDEIGDNPTREELKRLALQCAQSIVGWEDTLRRLMPQLEALCREHRSQPLGVTSPLPTPEAFHRMLLPPEAPVFPEDYLQWFNLTGLSPDDVAYLIDIGHLPPPSELKNRRFY